MNHLPNVILDIIKEYIPYCALCYDNLHNIRNFFNKHAIILYYKDMTDSRGKDCSNGCQCGVDETTLYKIQYVDGKIQFEMFEYYRTSDEHYKSYTLSIEDFTKYLTHNCQMTEINVSNKHTLFTITNPQIASKITYTNGAYKYSGLKEERDNYKNHILHIINLYKN